MFFMQPSCCHIIAGEGARGRALSDVDQSKDALRRFAALSYFNAEASHSSPRVSIFEQQLSCSRKLYDAARLYFSQAKMRFQSRFMLMTIQPLDLASS